MTVRPYILLEISLAETGGWVGKVGRPRLYCTLNAVHLPGTEIDDAMISIVARDRSTDSWQEHTRRLTLEQSQAILASLDKLGITEKPLQVESVFDTSDLWSRLSFRGRDGDKSFALDIGMQSSGFDGNDAEGLRGLLRQLFDYAGYADYSPTIYGYRDVSG